MCQDYETTTMAELLEQNLQYGLRNTTKVPLEERDHQLNIYRAILSYQYNERIQFNICIDRGAVFLPCFKAGIPAYCGKNSDPWYYRQSSDPAY